MSISHNKMKINYLNGDATNPKTNGLKYIAHVCNNRGAWGAGFVMALSKKWDKPENHYRNLNEKELTLGNIYFVPVEGDIVVANMIAQNGFITSENQTPLDYESLDTCLNNLYLMAKRTNATVHMPKIGSGLGGGDWNRIESLIKKNMTVETYVYIFN